MIAGGFKYRTFNGFSDQLLSDWGCQWPANTWVSVCTIPVVGNTGCTQFQIVNNGNGQPNNTNFFISLGGVEKTGIIEPTPVNFGACTADCLGVIGGTALPGTPCNDNNACTINDVYTGTAPNCGCAGTPVAGPTMGATGSNSPICAGSTLNLNATATGGTVTYSWAGPNGFNSTAQNPSIVLATVAATGTYTVTASNGCGTNATAQVPVTVNALPTPTISAGGPTTFCAGGSVVLTSSSATGNVWSPGGATTQSITVSSSGTYSVTVTSNGCSGTSTGTAVTVNPNPATPTITAGGPTTFCAGGSVVLTSSSATGNVWSPGGATTQSITVSSSGTYSVTVTSNGCSATSAGTTVTVNPVPATPTISAGGPTTFCAGGSVVLTSSSGSGNVWSPGGATTQSITVSSSGTYSVTVTSNGCSATSAGTTVTVNPLPATPTISAGGPTTFCAGGSVVLTSSSATGNVWSPGGATTQSITVSSSGTYSVTVTSNGCSATSAGTTVTVNPVPATPTISAGGPTTFCAGGSVVLTSSSVRVTCGAQVAPPPRASR